MKKFLSIAAAMCLCFALVGCTPEAEEEGEEIIEKENDIALSMTYPKNFDGMNYMVADNWQEKITDAQVTYYTDYNTIMISSTTEGDTEALFEQMLEAEGLSVEGVLEDLGKTPEEGKPEEAKEPEAEEPLEGADAEEGDLQGPEEALDGSFEEEDIEIDSFSGTKRTLIKGEKRTEFFTIFVGDKTYGIIVSFDGISDQGKSYEATDTLLSSIRFDIDPELEAQRMEDRLGENQEGAGEEEGPGEAA